MNRTSKTLSVSILSLSLLTVMAGAAIAPALGVLQEHFSQSSAATVQMIVSMPAIFIVIGNMIFPKLTSRFGSKTLVMIGLALYVIGGCIAGAFDNIYVILAMRAFVGLGVGILMPLSTGLLSYYYPPEKLDGMMGYSSAMNQMGGVVATLITGVLSGISWRASFLVYLLGLISVVLCLLFLPNDNLSSASAKKETGSASESEHAEQNRKSGNGIFRTYWPYIVGMFLLMTVFFIYPTNFAMITVADGIIPARLTSLIMASMDFVAFLGGLSFAPVRRKMGESVRYAAPLLFLIGYALMVFMGGWIGTIAGSLFIGFANGIGIPYLISGASEKAGASAVTTVIPMISGALYLAQFLCPFLISLLQQLFHGGVHFPYIAAIVFAAALIGVSSRIKAGNADPKTEPVKEVSSSSVAEDRDQNVTKATSVSAPHTPK